jgi:hypothetical protein
MTKRKKLRAVVQKILKPSFPRDKEKVEISVQDADELYREIRVENVLTGDGGEKVRLKPGAEIDVVLEADSNATTKAPD